MTELNKSKLENVGDRIWASNKEINKMILGILLNLGCNMPIS